MQGSILEFCIHFYEGMLHLALHTRPYLKLVHLSVAAP